MFCDASHLLLKGQLDCKKGKDRIEEQTGKTPASDKENPSLGNLGDVFERLKKGEGITSLELTNFILTLIRSNTPFQLTFAPRTQTAFASLSLTITLSPKLSTAVSITITDQPNLS